MEALAAPHANLGDFEIPPIKYPTALIRAEDASVLVAVLQPKPAIDFPSALPTGEDSRIHPRLIPQFPFRCSPLDTPSPPRYLFEDLTDSFTANPQLVPYRDECPPIFLVFENQLSSGVHYESFQS